MAELAPELRVALEQVPDKWTPAIEVKLREGDWTDLLALNLIQSRMRHDIMSTAWEIRRSQAGRQALTEAGG